MTARAVDVAVIGGGAFGMWCGLAAAAAGADAIVLEAGAEVFAGASATPVGALTPFPFAAEGDALAAFQADALMAMPRAIDALQDRAARPAGYRVGGRITPLADQTARDRGEAQARDGQRRMPRSPLGGPATWRVGGASAEWAGLFAADIGAAGWLIDSVSAQIDAERYAAALLAAARGLPGLTVTTGWSVEALRGTGADWRLDSASGTLLARQVIIAAGWHAGRIAGLIGAADDPARYRVGAGIPAVGSAARADRPVKGQAARLSLDPALRPATAPETMPAVQAPGVFIVHHGGGAVAVGATSEAGETDCATDAGLDGVIARAVALMPALVAARVERRWAGIRPRPPGTLPRIGQVADAPGLWHASGGFKIGLALAHHAGLAVAAAALGIEPGAAIGPFGPAPRLPAAFAPGPVRAPA